MISANDKIQKMNIPKYHFKLEADKLKSLSIWELKEGGWLSSTSPKCRSVEWGESLSISLGSWLGGVGVEKIRVIYSQDNYEFDYFINLLTTSCNYGGLRYWFECPFCRRQVGVLYFRGSYFGCRHCQFLTYESRNLSGMEKVAGKMISFPKIERYKERAKRKQYDGKITKKYSRYLEIKRKSMFAWKMNILMDL